ncbi:MAG: surface lipoprotein assembly modifier [Rhodospirillales bacterium]|nr:surface lipoprotein assembly modifier [Rhodospirillales bacterium]
MTALVAVGAHAEPVEPTGQPPAAAPEISDLAAGRLLVQAGRFEDALVFLKQAQPANEEEAIERHFLLGAVYMRLRQPREAAEQYEAILVIRPDLTRVRLELARAHYAAGQDDKAKYHFQLSLGDRLPSSVESAVESFLNAIDARKRWSAHVSIAALPETNAVRRTDRETVQIGGATFRLNEDAREASGIGTQLSAGGAYFPTVGDGLRGHFALSTAAKLYEQSAWNDIALVGKAGLTRLFEGGSASGGVQVGRRWQGTAGFQSSVGPWARVDYRLSNRTRVGANTNADYRKHDERDDLDGWRISLNPIVRYVLDSQTVLEAGPQFELVEARTDHRSSRLAGLGVGVSRAFENGITASLSASAQLNGYRGEDPLFEKTREDRIGWLSVRVLHRSLQLSGFAPYVGYTYERSTSNIPLHDYENHGAILGLTREF